MKNVIPMGHNAGANAQVGVPPAGNMTAGAPTLFEKLIDRYGDTEVPITALYLAVSIQLLQVLTKSLASALSRLNENSKNMERLNDLLVELNRVKAKQGTAKTDDDIPDDDPDFIEAKRQLQQNGYPVDKIKTWGDWDVVTSEVKADSDSFSNASAQFQLAVQNNNSALANASDQGTNGLNKAWTTLQTIVANYR